MLILMKFALKLLRASHDPKTPLLNLKVLRLKASLPQKDLARVIRVPQPKVSYWEHGLSIPPKHLEDLKALFVSLGVLDPSAPSSCLGSVSPEWEGGTYEENLSSSNRG